MARADSPFAPSMIPTWIGIALLRLCIVLPYPWLLALGRQLGRLTERFVPRRRAIVDTNFALCFPEMSALERLQLRHRHFEAVGIAVLEVAIAWWWSDRRLLPLAEVEGEQHQSAVKIAGDINRPAADGDTGESTTNPVDFPEQFGSSRRPLFEQALVGRFPISIWPAPAWPLAHWRDRSTRRPVLHALLLPPPDELPIYPSPIL